MSYKLSRVLNDHKGDVLGLTVTHDNHIISCSRDGTAKLWLLDKSTEEYVVFETYSTEQHVCSKFITCVCIIPSNDIFKNGLLVTGGSDHKLHVFEFDSSIPLQQLQGHQNTVCKVINSVETNVILSASWDATVKVWRISPETSECIKTIEFNGSSVWAVLHMKRDFICTGTADKIVRIFSGDGKLLKSLSGHEDCIRDLAEVNEDEILSCSNDATIRRWSVLTGICLDILYGHPNYIYSIRIFDRLTASSGEDRCLLLWSKGHHLQTINVPARSIWTVEFLPNKDIVVGSSDGVIRIFTANEERQATEEMLDAFYKECINFAVPFKKYIGRSKVSRLPGPDVLKDVGTREGQMKIIRENEKITCYSWSLDERKWKKLGNVDAAVPKLLKGSNVIKRETPARPEEKNIFICAVCRRFFTRKYVMRRHFQRTNHSVANKTPAYLRSVLPREWHYYVCKFKRKGTRFRAEICLSTINTITEAHEWIRRFSNQNKYAYRRYSTKRSPRGFISYAEHYKCQQAFLFRKSNKLRKKGKGCKSSIHLAIKRDFLGLPCFTKVNLNFMHDHSEIRKPSSEMQEKFYRMFQKGLNPATAFHTYKKETIFDGRNPGPDYDWVKFHYQSFNGNTLKNVKNKSSVLQQSSVDPTEQRNFASCFLKTETNDPQVQSEHIEYILPDVEDMISEVEVEPDINIETNDNQLLNQLQENFDNFVTKLQEEDIKYFKPGILSMCDELEKACQASPRCRVSALLSFNREPNEFN